MKAIAVIPCHNEALHIADVVSKMGKFAFQVIVIDDHSVDETAEKARQGGATVFQNWGGKGFGAALNQGMTSALARVCDVIVTLDGDGQHNPNETQKLLEPIENGEADVVVGSRFICNHSNIPKYRIFGIKIITWLYNVFSRHKLSDAQCCFRVYQRSVLEALSFEEKGFTFSTETLIKARAMGFIIKEVPVKVLYHKQFSRNSTLNPIKHGLGVALGTIKVRLKVELWGKIQRMIKW